MAMFAFLEHYDLAGKRIIPFCTNEGSGMGSSERDLKKTCTGATVERGLSIRGCEAEKSEKKCPIGRKDWCKDGKVSIWLWLYAAADAAKGRPVIL